MAKNNLGRGRFLVTLIDLRMCLLIPETRDEFIMDGEEYKKENEGIWREGEQGRQPGTQAGLGGTERSDDI